MNDNLNDNLNDVEKKILIVRKIVKNNIDYVLAQSILALSKSVW